eukprot:GHVT01077724.1.p1 GENE.GHVT01077724.1~~GHVT01077724.1.p1  ORF type:complete len:377 (+),score=45.97 GHVT01077724.1:722-1852(+)
MLRKRVRSFRAPFRRLHFKSTLPSRRATGTALHARQLLAPTLVRGSWEYVFVFLCPMASDAKMIKAVRAASLTVIALGLIGGGIAFGFIVKALKSADSTAPASGASTAAPPSAPSSPASLSSSSPALATEAAAPKAFGSGPLNTYIQAKPPTMNSNHSHVDPRQCHLFAHPGSDQISRHWLERDAEELNLVSHPSFVLTNAKITEQMLRNQSAKNEKVAYMFIDWMPNCDYNKETDKLVPRTTDRFDDHKDSLRGLLCPFHISNVSNVRKGDVGPKAIPIPLLHQDAQTPLVGLAEMKRILELERPIMERLISNGYKIVVVGPQPNHATSPGGFPMHHGLGTAHRVRPEPWIQVIHKFLFELSLKTAIRDFEARKK